MHICFNALDYPSHLGGSGVGNQVQMLGRALVQAGHRVSVIALADRSLPSFSEDQGVRVHRVACGNVHWYLSKLPLASQALVLPVRELERSLAAYRKISAIHQDDPIDVIEGTETGMALVARWLPEIPIVARLHGEPYTFCKHTAGMKLPLSQRLSRRIQRAALRRARLLISPSGAHASEIAAELSRHPPIEVVPNALALEMENHAPEPPASGEAVAGPTVLFVGRLDRSKGVVTLLEAARQFLADFPNSRLVLAGSAHPSLPRTELDAIVERLPQRGERVAFLGHVPWRDLFALYEKATICVLPSHYETFGLAALEPMAFGVPVVATSAGGLPEIVQDGVTGLLVRPGDAEALGNAIGRLLKDRNLRRELASTARQFARSGFSLAQCVQRTMALYHRAGGGERTPAELVFLSPHLDDVVLSCGGLIDGAVRRGDNVRVITVFAGLEHRADPSAFARHLHRKWDIAFGADDRLREDHQALGVLGVKRIEQWDFPEAAYRRSSSGQSLYCSYEQLKSPWHADDNELIERLLRRIEAILDGRPGGARIHVPLALGGHVDHRILFEVGLRLCAAGHDVRFYEDWPYAESVEAKSPTNGWICHFAPISIGAKVAASAEYRSQLPGLGTSVATLRRRMERYHTRAHSRQAQERYWAPSVSTLFSLKTKAVAVSGIPHTKRIADTGPSDFRSVLAMLKWHDLDEVLPGGAGLCVDIGCGNGRHRPLIEERGYRWRGFDVAPDGQNDAVEKADCRAIPVDSGTAAAVVAWQMMEYVAEPGTIVAEASRLLEPGGVFCGSVSFLEPVHGRTYLGMSHLAVEHLLRQHGFQDVETRPGLCGFALSLWTWLRRLFGPRAGPLAVPLTASWFVPLAATRFLSSWMASKLGLGGGHGMRWLTRTAPLEFAGHVMFLARKPAGTN